MKIGLIGLGKMGSAMVTRLLQGSHEVVVFDNNKDIIIDLTAKGAIAASSVTDMISKLEEPRIIWSMVPAGEITDGVILNLTDLLTEGDIVIDGGNSNYKESIEHSNILSDRGIHFLDAGTSGGIWGLEIGYCLMVGGNKKIFETVEPIFKTLAPEDGYQHVGPAGSGHYVKMIHNGIEYAMMQSYAEGFEILKAKKEFDIDTAAVSKLWNHGSVIRSWLLELIESTLQKNAGLEDIAPYVEDSGEGRWTVMEAIAESVPAPVITLSLMNRFSSRQDNSFATRLLAAMRNEFGGHSIKKK